MCVGVAQAYLDRDFGTNGPVSVADVAAWATKLCAGCTVGRRAHARAPLTWARSHEYYSLLDPVVLRRRLR